jgi:phage-related protein
MLSVQFYPDGDEGPVKKYLESLRLAPQRKDAYVRLMADLTILEAEGLLSKLIHLERVVGVDGSVWELKRSYEGIRYRVYFCVESGEAWLIHCLEKKTPKIPRSDLKLIRKRSKGVLG